MSLDDKLARVVSRFEELQALIAEHADPGSADYTGKLKEFSSLTPVVEGIRAYRSARDELDDLDALRQDSEGDAALRDLAEQEYRDVKQRLPELEQQVKILLLPKDEADARNAILEVRAGTGGEEASLFAMELFGMYQRWAELEGFRFSVLDVEETDLGGLKNGSAEIAGQEVFAKLKYESGVHRVQRVPVTESGGRIHTSAATVAVLPEAEEVDLQVEDKDLRIDTYRSQGAGGQHVNTTNSAVRITHLPTGIVAQCQDEKSQHKNKAKAMKMLRARIYDAERQRREEEYAAARKSQVGSGDRSERIRTYNFPQGRVTDHRINLTLYKLDKVVAGEALGEVIEALISEDQAARLALMQ
ncbi:peptide chain release factor 1 [Algihabitans albus]|uniref:peptide chain release factor 1 n=1 Tax=Algihabitans albus TaxID=2164067 RepID=UPI0035D0F31F